MRIATWNVNSVKQRVPRLLPWLDERQPDVVCLQETKLADETEAAQRGELGLDRLTHLLQLDDTLPTLAADPDTIRDAIKAVGEETQVTGERSQP